MQALPTSDFLRRCSYFSCLDRPSLEALLAICQERRYATGERLFSEGEGTGSAELFLLVEGVARIFKRSDDGREQVLGLMRPGDTFGEAPVFDGGAYPANAEALTPTTVLAISGDDLWAVIEEHPRVAHAALKMMAGRLRHLTGLVEDLALRRVMSRVAKLLLDQDRELVANQSQMATMVGSAREVVNRSLHALSDLGAIELHGQSIVVTNPDELRLIARTG